MNSIQIISYIYSFKEKLLETAKIIKILEWLAP
jgi:hypothetical protein